MCSRKLAVVLVALGSPSLVACGSSGGSRTAPCSPGCRRRRLSPREGGRGARRRAAAGASGCGRGRDPRSGWRTPVDSRRAGAGYGPLRGDLLRPPVAERLSPGWERKHHLHRAPESEPGVAPVALPHGPRRGPFTGSRLPRSATSASRRTSTRRRYRPRRPRRSSRRRPSRSSTWIRLRPSTTSDTSRRSTTAQAPACTGSPIRSPSALRSDTRCSRPRSTRLSSREGSRPPTARLSACHRIRLRCSA